MPLRIADYVDILLSGESGERTTTEIFTDLFRQVDARIAAIEGVSSSLAALQQQIAASGETLVAATLDPLVAEIRRKADLGALLTTSSVSEVEVGTGLRTIVVTQAEARAVFAPAHMLSIVVTDDPSVALYGRRVSYDPATGVLVVDVTSAVGEGTWSSWTIAPAAVAPYASQVTSAPVDGIAATTVQAALAALAVALAARQPRAETLTALAGLALAADRVIATGSDGSAALAPLGGVGRSLLAVTDKAAGRAAIEAAPITNAGLLGAPTCPTAPVTADSDRIANVTAVRAAIAGLVSSSPATLDTLAELAAALGNDANFATTVVTALGGKQPLDATLTALAAMTTAADKLIYATGVDTFATATLTPLARQLLAAKSPATARSVVRATGLVPNVAKRNRITGAAWLISTSAADNGWTRIVWAAELGLFVAVANTGTGNRVMTSPDGVTWTARSSAADNNWQGLAWSPELGLFVAVANTGTGNRVMTSPDGITWTARTSAADNSWVRVCWAAEIGLFVAVANSGTNRVMTSPDGITWTARATPVANSWNAVYWSAELGLLVAVATSGTGDRVMTSPDGVTWTVRASAADNNWQSVCWAPELRLFVAVANTGTGDRVMTSPDGIVWTARSSAADNNWQSVCWAAEIGLFVAVASSGAGNRVMTSPDGLVWTARISATDNFWWSACWSAELGLFAAIAATGTGNRAMTSVSGHSLTYRSA
jgi:hypothetical protein